MSLVLVIEDSPAISLLLRRRIERHGFRFEARPNGVEALLRLQQEPLPDVVLADVMMPGIDGIETTRRIRSEHPGLPVILVTAQELSHEQRREADAVIRKPIEFPELFEAIERLAPACRD